MSHTSKETIPTFPALYTINSNQKLYEWTISIVKSNPTLYQVITTHGEKEGKKVVHSKDYTEGKVKRSILEQCVLEATRKWKNKKEKELYSEDLQTLDMVGEKDNGSASSVPTTVVRPMLANKFEFESYKKTGRAYKIPFPAFVQRKYDGVRCISYLKDGNIVLESRTGVPFENLNHLREELHKHLSKFPKHFYFDGEIYSDSVDFQSIVGLIHLKEKYVKPVDTEKMKNLTYHIYDFIDLENADLPYDKRYHFLQNFFKTHKTNYLRNVESILINKVEEVQTYHDQFVAEGYEGIMIRATNGPYEVQKRSKYLQKFKEFMEEEFEIIGFHEGTGIDAGSVIWECKTNEGAEFSVRPVGTQEYRKDLFSNAKKYIGKMLTVRFQGFTNDGVLRFPTGKAIRSNY